MIFGFSANALKNDVAACWVVVACWAWSSFFAGRLFFFANCGDSGIVSVSGLVAGRGSVCCRRFSDLNRDGTSFCIRSSFSISGGDDVPPLDAGGADVPRRFRTTTRRNDLVSPPFPRSLFGDDGVAAFRVVVVSWRRAWKKFCGSSPFSENPLATVENVFDSPSSRTRLPLRPLRSSSAVDSNADASSVDAATPSFTAISHTVTSGSPVASMASYFSGSKGPIIFF
mmetsp:Transcript_35531/g.113540  ORF Transcript_35531/g.113540 Transcript_35531/m.113540 type:complete len:227 (+) Transcript_35531:869-1549(+)